MSDQVERKLNEEQKEAVDYGNGPLLIIAGAGTGKTMVVTERIKQIVASELAKPSEILALTFTEKASREMEERVDIAMPYGYTQMWISTFHSFCDRILRAEALNIGLNPRYNLMTQAETIQFFRKNLFKFDLNYFRPLGNPNKFIEGMISHFSRLKDEDVNSEDYMRWVNDSNKKPANTETQKQNRNTENSELLTEDFNKYQELAKAYETYEELKTKDGLVDFSDLIANTLKLFRTRKNILKKYQDQFKYILIDEFQDTNFAQYAMIKLLAPPEKNPNLTVVGDDSQCLPGDSKILTRNGDKRIDLINIGDVVLTAIGKGHTSFSMVSKIFKKKAKVKLLTFKLEDGENITVTDNHKMFCYIPSRETLRNYYYVYLMCQEKLGWRLGITNDLASRLRIEHHADKIIGIGSFNTEQEARYYEAYYSAKYSLPTVPFTPRPNQAISGIWLDKIFSELDTNSAAKKLAKVLRLELDSPHFCIGGVKRGVTDRVKINFQMCYRNYRSKTNKEGFVGNPLISHIVWVETSSKQAIENLKKAGFSLEEAKRGKRFRFTSNDLAKVWEMANKLVIVTGGILEENLYNKPIKNKPLKKKANLMILADNAVNLGKPDLAKNFRKYSDEAMK